MSKSSFVFDLPSSHLQTGLYQLVQRNDYSVYCKKRLDIWPRSGYILLIMIITIMVYQSTRCDLSDNHQSHLSTMEVES